MPQFDSMSIRAKLEDARKERERLLEEGKKKREEAHLEREKIRIEREQTKIDIVNDPETIRANGDFSMVNGQVAINGKAVDSMPGVDVTMTEDSRHVKAKNIYSTGTVTVTGYSATSSNMQPSEPPVHAVESKPVPPPQPEKLEKKENLIVPETQPIVEKLVEEKSQEMPSVQPTEQKVSAAATELSIPVPAKKISIEPSSRPVKKERKPEFISKMKPAERPMTETVAAEKFKERRSKLVGQLQERFKSNELDITSERDFVRTHWGAEASADIVFITGAEEQEALEFISKAGFKVQYSDELNALYMGELNLIFVKRKPELYKDREAEEFFARSTVVHEFTHATFGRAEYVPSAEQFQPGDAVLKAARKNDILPGKIIWNEIHPSKPRTGFAHTNNEHLEESYGFFLEEACAVWSEFEWKKREMPLGRIPESVVKNLSGLISEKQDLVEIGEERIEIPWYGWTVLKNDSIGINELRFAGMALELIFEADPSLIEDFKEARQGKVDALRRIPKKIESLLGRGSYEFLKTQHIDEGSDFERYFSRYKRIKEILEKRKQAQAS